MTTLSVQITPKHTSTPPPNHTTTYTSHEIHTAAHFAHFHTSSVSEVRMLVLSETHRFTLPHFSATTLRHTKDHTAGTKHTNTHFHTRFVPRILTVNTTPHLAHFHTKYF